MLSPWEGATTHTQLSRPMPSGHHIAWSTDCGDYMYRVYTDSVLMHTDAY